MSVLVYAESSEGKFKKVALEATSYGKNIAEQLGTNLVVLTINVDNSSELNMYGAEKVLSVKNDELQSLNSKVVADVIKQSAEKENATVVIIDSNANGIALAPLVAVNLNAGYASNAVALPSNTSPLQ